MKALTRILAIFHKEVMQLTRDKLTFGMIVGIPIIQLILFGFAINTDVRHLGAAYADQSNSLLSNQLLSDIAASQVLDFSLRVDTAQELQDLLNDGSISVGLFIPHDFDRRIISQNRHGAQLLVDGSDPVIIGVARQLSSITSNFDSKPNTQKPSSVLEIRNFYNPERRSAVNIVPGLIGVILTMTMVLFTAVAIVREKERGNIELLINTPVKTIELMLGKIAPYIAIGLIQVTLILLLGWFVFSVPIRGALLDVYIITLFFIATNLALGLLISTVASTQFQAMQMTFFFFLPSILLSGFMFPFDGMPQAAQIISEVLPLTHFLRLIRGVMLRGGDVLSMMNEIYALLAFMIVALGLTLARFSKTLG